MGFLAPWFLVGATAVGLPIWLHLLKKHKATPLPFSSLDFGIVPQVGQGTVSTSCEAQPPPPSPPM